MSWRCVHSEPDLIVLRSDVLDSVRIFQKSGASSLSEVLSAETGLFETIARVHRRVEQSEAILDRFPEVKVTGVPISGEQQAALAEAIRKVEDAAFEDAGRVDG